MSAQEEQAMLIEHLGPGFAKYHLNHIDAAVQQPWPARPVLHHFTAPDTGAPHDHPWPFRSYVIWGSYIEEIWLPGVWSGKLFQTLHLREAGDVIDVPASRIHRIIALPEGDCGTLVTYGPTEREVRFYPELLAAAEGGA